LQLSDFLSTRGGNRTPTPLPESRMSGTRLPVSPPYKDGGGPAPHRYYIKKKKPVTLQLSDFLSTRGGNRTPTLLPESRMSGTRLPVSPPYKDGGGPAPHRYYIKKKKPVTLQLSDFLSTRGGNRTPTLLPESRMSGTRLPVSPPYKDGGGPAPHRYYIKKKKPVTLQLSDFLSTRGGNRTPTLLPELDFESSASTDSATRAFPFCGKWCAKLIISTKMTKLITITLQIFIYTMYMCLFHSRSTPPFNRKVYHLVINRTSIKLVYKA
jgi:hypothetical protein